MDEIPLGKLRGSKGIRIFDRFLDLWQVSTPAHCQPSRLWPCSARGIPEHTSEVQSKKPRVRALVQKIEEKRLDVDVVTRLLADTLLGNIGAAIVVTNDSDLSEPVAVAKRTIPLGVFNPHNITIAGELLPRRGTESINRTGSFNASLKSDDFTNHQLPDVIEEPGRLGRVRKPAVW